MAIRQHIPFVDTADGDVASVRHASDFSNAATAHAEIRRRILDNVYAPGMSVSVKELASALGMSRTPIRYALIRLREEQLVELVPRHGFRVLPIAPEDMQEIYRILAHLEQLAIELIGVRRPSAEELLPLHAAAKAMQAAIEADDLESWAAADASFHRHLFDLSGSRRLYAMAEGFWNQVHRVRMLTLHLRPRPEKSTREHLRLAEALLAGDIDAAGELHRAQRRRSGDELINILKRCNFRHL
jgi:DNA-binding GntR family transcriptional regulator